MTVDRMFIRGDIMKKSKEELTKILNNTYQEIPTGSFWQHYKGNIYVVKGLTVDCDTNEIYIVYNEYMNSSIIFSRLYKSWVSFVLDSEIPIKRFVRVEPKEVTIWQEIKETT